MTEERVHVDVLVVGGGMAGLAAASEAARRGAVVGVVEKLSEVGGSAAMSAGILWSPRSYEEMRARMPGGEAALAKALTDDFPAALDAVQATGVEVSELIDGPYFGFGFGRQVDVVGLFRRWERDVEVAGGWVVRDTACRRLLANDDGRVIGAVVVGVDGATEVDAGAVILATGGIVGDPELMASFLGPDADRALVRANPGSVGDGFRLGRSVGGAASRSLSSFYGHLVSYPIDDWGERHYLPLTQYHSIHCILVNRHGRRFIDESLGDEFSNQDILKQPDCRAILLADEETRRAFVVTAPYPHGEVVDRFAAGAEAGANYAVGGTLDELVSQVAAWGVPAGTLRATLAAYDRAAAGEDVVVDAPMPARPAPLRVAPFHAIEVQPAITYVYGALRIDADARVLDRDDRPVAGLYAAGADGGGAYHRGYGGGLGLALVFGRRAGRAAVPDVRPGEPAA